MIMRAQVSLQFDDEKLFNEMIKPFKEARILNGLIIKCLSAYFYNDKIKSLIEGTEVEEQGVSDTPSSSQELFDNIRATLLAQDFLAQELKDTIQEGTEDVSSILDGANRVMKESGMASVKNSSDEGKNEVLQLELKKSRSDGSPESTSNSSSGGLTSAEFELLKSYIELIAKRVVDPSIVACIHEGKGVMEEMETSDKVETASQVGNTDVGLNVKEVEVNSEPAHIEEEATIEDDFNEGSDIPIVDESPVIEKTVEVKPVEVKAPPVRPVVIEESVSVAPKVEPVQEVEQAQGVSSTDEDASDAMGDLLASLGI